MDIMTIGEYCVRPHGGIVRTLQNSLPRTGHLLRKRIGYTVHRHASLHQVRRGTGRLRRVHIVHHHDAASV